MIRRTFRIGVRLGLLCAIGFAIVKVMQSRRPSEGAAGVPAPPWPPVEPPTPAPAPTVIAAAPAPAPSAPAPAPPKSEPTVTIEPPTQPAAPAVSATKAAKKAAKAVKKVEKAAKAERRPRPLRADPVSDKAADAPVEKAAKKTAKKAAKATKKAPARGWVEPQGQVCPLSHPIKAKLDGSVYHLPGMFNYTRTRPDRCYATEAAAKRDGLTSAKR